MPSAVARTFLIGAMLVAVVACGYDTSATFNSDGTATVGLKFLLPTSLLQGGSGASVTGLSPADIAKANTTLASTYPGAKVTLVTEGTDSGAQLTIPFKTEKDAFAFLTQPSKLSPAGATSGSASGINLANTGGLFASATHTTSGETDTYTFKTQPAPLTSPSPGSQDIQLPPDVLASIFTVTFSLTVPHEIQSAPGALFTLDRKTAIWKLSLTDAQTLTASTGSSVGLAGLGSNSAAGQSTVLLIGVGLAAVALGFILGKITPWLLVRGPAVVPAAAPAAATADFPPPASWLPTAETRSGAMTGPPPEMPPPPNPTDN